MNKRELYINKLIEENYAIMKHILKQRTNVDWSKEDIDNLNKNAPPIKQTLPNNYWVAELNVQSLNLELKEERK